MVKRLLKIFNIMGLTFLGLIVVFVTNGSVEYIYVQNNIQEFKERAEFDFTIEAINTTYYKVYPKYEYEDNTRSVLTFEENLEYIGSAGDIILTNRNPATNIPVLTLIISYFAKYFYVGHSTVNAIDPRLTYEVVGNDEISNEVRKVLNDWLYLDYNTRHIIGLRVKNINNDLAKDVENYCDDKIGYPYNYTFAFNRNNSYYCTDLISRAYHSANVGINYDYLGTTGNDLILSDNTYMIFYREVVIKDGQNHFNIYYLKEDTNV
ncbi:MAG: hypothetical protein WC927_02510 [Bacilli bacterium]|jgi:hypothetical protein